MADKHSGKGDGARTAHGWKRILSAQNAQGSTLAGALAATAGGIMANQPNPWVQFAGQVLIALGTAGVVVDSQARPQ